MGDMADMSIEAFLDDEEWITDYLLGFHDDEEAYERGYIDERGALLKSVHYKTCRCCGSTGLTWGEYKGRWRLFHGESIHVCPVNPLNDV